MEILCIGIGILICIGFQVGSKLMIKSNRRGYQPISDSLDVDNPPQGGVVNHTYECSFTTNIPKDSAIFNDTVLPVSSINIITKSDDTHSDMIKHPSHYISAPMEVIDAIEGLQLPYHESNILKYIARWKHKNGVEDLRKAEWYLKRLIDNNTKELE